MGSQSHIFFSCNLRCSRRYTIATMNRMIVLFAVFATACAAPTQLALPAAGLAGWGGYAGLGGYAGYAGLAAAPLAAAPAISLPAPYTTQHVAGPDAVSVHQPPPVVTKKLEYADRHTSLHTTPLSSSQSLETSTLLSQLP